jgi:hypothetical protein
VAQEEGQTGFERLVPYGPFSECRPSSGVIASEYAVKHHHGQCVAIPQSMKKPECSASVEQYGNRPF